MSEFLTAALEYAARGWSIIPVRHGGGKDKRPALKSWKRYQTKRPTEATLKRWFSDGRKCDGLAVILGSVSGNLVCRDFDDADAYERWSATHSDIAASLPTVKTGRGYHVYIRNDTTRIAHYGDGELRGAGCCVLPPSRHPSGAVYEWLIPLPDGDLPRIDPIEAGLARGTEHTEQIEQLEQSEAIKFGLSADSISELLDEDIERAIQATLPLKAGQRNRKIFDFVRMLKAIPALADAEAVALRDIFKRWHVRALPVIETKCFDESWFDFSYAWKRVKFAAGTGPMEAALKNADAAPIPRGMAEKYDSPLTHRLVKLCCELQRMSDDNQFFLSCRTAAELLGIDHRTAWRRLGMLESDGVIHVVTRGSQGRATRYRYVDTSADA